MRYDFRITGPDERIAVGICASSADEPMLSAVLTGDAAALTDRNLMRVFLKIPAITIKVIAAIHWEALRLWVKGIRLAPRDQRRLSMPATIVTAQPAYRIETQCPCSTSKPSRDRSIRNAAHSRVPIAEAFLRRIVRELECGELVIETPAGDRLVFVGAGIRARRRR